jgi:hypothetical protein
MKPSQLTDAVPLRQSVPRQTRSATGPDSLQPTYPEALGGWCDARISIEPITPPLRLPIEMIDIGKANPRPEAVFNHPDAPLDLAFRLWLERPTDPRRDPKRSHEIGEQRIPDGGLAIHVQEDTLHAIGQGSFG